MPTPLSQKQAAAYLNMSVNTFKRHVRPYIKRIVLGRKMLFRIEDLDRWQDRTAR